MYYFYFLLLFLPGLLCSCNHGSDPSDQAYVNSLIETSPDSALNFLVTYYPFENLKLDACMQRLLWEIQAKDKAAKDISKDTTILIAEKYFEGKKSEMKNALALFYCGRVCMENKNYSGAMEYFIRAVDVIMNSDSPDFNLLGLIYYYTGDLFKIQEHYHLATDKYKAATACFRSAESHKNENHTHIALSYIYLLRGNADSTLYYCQKVFHYAEECNDSVSMSEALKISGSIGIQRGDYENAKMNMLLSMNIHTTGEDMITKSLYLCDIYLKLGNLDSALYYLSENRYENEHCRNPIIACEYYSLLSKISNIKGDFKNALAFSDKAKAYADSVNQEVKQNSLLEIHQKYNVKKLNDVYEESLRSGKIIEAIAIISILSAFISIVVMGSRLNNLKKELFQKKEKEKEILTKQEKLKTLLAQRFEISKQLAIISASPAFDPGERKLLSKINEIIYGTSDIGFNWDEFYLLLNELHDNLSFKLKAIFTELSEYEVHLCCLIKAGFTTSDICFILNIVPITVRMKKTAIRKKLGIKNGGDIAVFIDDFFCNYSQFQNEAGNK